MPQNNSKAYSIGVNLYVSPRSSGGAGTLDDPYSLAECVTQLRAELAGSACLLLSGRYQPLDSRGAQP